MKWKEITKKAARDNISIKYIETADYVLCIPCWTEYTDTAVMKHATREEIMLLPNRMPEKPTADYMHTAYYTSANHYQKNLTRVCLTPMNSLHFKWTCWSEGWNIHVIVVTFKQPEWMNEHYRDFFPQNLWTKMFERFSPCIRILGQYPCSISVDVQSKKCQHSSRRCTA